MSRQPSTGPAAPAAYRATSGEARPDVAAWAAALAAATLHDTVLRRWLQRVAEHPTRVAFHVLAAGGAPTHAALTWADWAGAARAVAAALVRDGVAPGDRVAVLAGNAPLWPVADLGALLAGAVSVGVFPTATTAQARQIVRDAAARVLLCDAAREPTARAAVAGSPGTPVVVDRALADWAPSVDDSPEVDRRAAAAAPADDAMLIYTSGSTGQSKGARIPHAYLLASAESVRDTLGLTAEDRSLSVLPFAHAAERVFGLHTRIVCGMEAGLVADATRAAEASRAYAPTLVGGLPRQYEKLHAALEAAAVAATGEARERWTRLRELGTTRSRLRRDGTAIPGALEREWAALREPAARVIAHALGHGVRLATSGGAPLRRDVAEALDAYGLTVLGAYGQTEHLCVAFHRPDAYDVDGVGRPMPGTTLRIADDGEIQVRRGALTFAGYLGRGTDSAAAFTPDGQWLRTGDLGCLDSRGVLHVTGRIKELLALSTGRKVAPLPIEARLCEHPGVSHAVVLGEGRRFAAALLFVPGGEEADAALAAHVARVNASLASHERIVRWAAVAEELTEADGALTPTLKVRRSVVAARYHARVEALFA